MDLLAGEADESTESDTDAASPQEVLDRCFAITPGHRELLAKGKVPRKLLRSMAWVTGRPVFRWQTAMGLIGIAAGPQILWLQSGEPTLLTWLSPVPLAATLAWWVLRLRAYTRLSQRHLGRSMVTSVEGPARTSTRWSADASGERTPHQTLHLGEESFPLPSSLGERTIVGMVRVHILSLVSLPEPSAPPTRWVVAVELKPPT